MNLTFEHITHEVAKRNTAAAICIIVSTKGSTPRKKGAKMVVFENGEILGTIGGGALEKAVILNAQHAIKQREEKLFRHDLLHQHSMCCGGTVDIYIEPIMKKEKLYIFGAGHTGAFLAKYAIDCGFETYLIDDRKEYLENIECSGINKMNLPFDAALSVLPFDEQTYSVILTYNHSTDRNILMHCVRQPFAYLGMIGSERKIVLTRKLLLESEITTTEILDRVDMPIGTKLAADGPAEIAISIILKLIETRSKKKNSCKELTSELQS